MKNVHDEIYQLESGTGSWVEVGKMRQGRSSHAVSEINYKEVKQFCTTQCDEEDQSTFGSGSGDGVDCS